MGEYGPTMGKKMGPASQGSSLLKERTPKGDPRELALVRTGGPTSSGDLQITKKGRVSNEGIQNKKEPKQGVKSYGG